MASDDENDLKGGVGSDPERQPTTISYSSMETSCPGVSQVVAADGSLRRPVSCSLSEIGRQRITK